MILTILKKEIKQFLRSPGDVFLLFAFPIILITTLSVGLKNMMNADGYNIFGENGKPDIVYYSVSDAESKYLNGFNAFIKGVESELDVKFKKCENLEEVKSKVNDYKALFYVEINSDGFELYSSNKGEKINSKILRSSFETILNDYAANNTIGKFNPEAFSSLVENEYDKYVEKESNGIRNVTSSEYYTFAELALIILYVAVTVGESVYNETSLNTISRIRLSKSNNSKLMAAKVIFGTIIAVFQTLLVYVYSSVVLDVNWGDNTLKFILLFIVFGIAASMFGAVLGMVAKKETSVNSMGNVFITIICAFGGCYTPIHMLVGIPGIEKIMYLSPIYWINTATSSMICGYDSTAYILALIIPISIAIVCYVIYTVTMKKRGGVLND